MRAAKACSASTASCCWTAWNLPIGLPNCARSLAYCSVIVSSRCSAPAISVAVISAPAACRSTAPDGLVPGNAPSTMSACRLPCTPLRCTWAAASGTQHSPSGVRSSSDCATAPKGTPGQCQLPSPWRCTDRRDGDRPGASVCAQHAARPHRLRQRHRQRVRAAGQPQREGVAQAGAALAGHQQVQVAGGLDGGPQRGRIGRALDLAHDGRRAGALQQLLEGFDQQRVHQRNPSPRAITPRRISRVPPRSEKVGQTCST